MSEESIAEPKAAPEEREIGLIEGLLVLARRAKLIAGICAATFVLACAVTLTMPNIYTATARILPPTEDQGGLAAMLGSMGGLASLVGVSPGGTSSELYVGMLRSRSVADAIIDRFELMEVYGRKTRLDTYDALGRRVGVELGKKDGIIAISVDDREPARAAAIANAYVEELKRLSVEINLSSAGRERDFLSARLEAARADLARAEERLQAFQTKNRTIRIDDQAKALIEAIASLKAELASREVQLGVLLTRQTERNPEVRATREAIAQLKAQLGRLEQSPGGKAITGDVFPAASEVPDLAIQYLRLQRDFKIQEALNEALIRQYELARINEAKNVSTIQVLDEAAEPDRKSRPRRSLLVLGATAVAFVLSVFLAFALEYVERMPEADRRRWRQLRTALPLPRRGGAAR